MNGVCGDNRFEIIAKVKEHLIKATNIERQPEELKYADNILFRLWQLGYFDSVEKISKLEEQVEDLKSDHEYNLELMKGLNERIAELNKVNEWHYVKDGDLPKVFDKPYLCKVYSHFEVGYFTAYKDQPWHFDEYYLDNEDVIAWKEIVLPELKEIE